MQPLSFEKTSSSTVKHPLTVLVCFCVYVCCFPVYCCIEPLRNAENTRIFLSIACLHSIVGVGLWFLLRKHITIKHNGIWFATIAGCTRLFVFPMQPWLSDDVWRYLWDGLLLADGINPYRFPPAAPELQAFRLDYHELYALLDYRHFSTIYPPLAQYVFALCVGLGEIFGKSYWGALWAWKGILLLSEFLGLLWTWKALRLWGHDTIWLWAYCCLPMTAIESSGQAHVDGLLIAPLGWLLWLMAQKQNHRGIIPIALAGAIKVLPIVLVLPIVTIVQNVKKRVLICAGLIVVSVGLWLPLFADYHILTLYLHHVSITTEAFQFNGGVYYAFCYCCEALHINNFWLFTPSILSFLRFCAVFCIGVLIVQYAKDRYRLVVYMLAVFSAALLIAAKVHTWYFLPLLLLNSAVGWKWLYALAAGSMLSYTFYSAVPNGEQYDLEMIVWGIAVCVGIGEYYGDRAKKIFSDIFVRK